jgi:REP element-mobilizing transposase RayT
VDQELKIISWPRQERQIRCRANPCTQIYIQVVFAVESRQNVIAPEHNDELRKFITGMVSGQRQKLIAINHMPDHLHLLDCLLESRSFIRLRARPFQLE